MVVFINSSGRVTWRALWTDGGGALGPLEPLSLTLTPCSTMPTYPGGALPPSLGLSAPPPSPGAQTSRVDAGRCTRCEAACGGTGDAQRRRAETRGGLALNQWRGRTRPSGERVERRRPGATRPVAAPSRRRATLARSSFCRGMVLTFSSPRRFAWHGRWHELSSHPDGALTSRSRLLVPRSLVPDAGCYCREIRFEVNAESRDLRTSMCHCKNCKSVSRVRVRAA